MKYTSTRKRSADTELAKATRRFKNDTGYDEGDWGKADTKYAPGPTYDHELRSGSIVEDEEDEFLKKLNAKQDSGHTYQRKGHEPVRVQHAKNGMYYAWRGSENVGTASLNHKGYFTSVHVEPQHRRTGVASALYNHVEKHAGLKLKPSERHTSDEAKKFWANRNKVQESAELQEMKGWMSPSGKPSTVSGHHAYEHHPDIWKEVDQEFRKQNPKAKRNLDHDEKWKSVGIAQRKGYTRFGREKNFGYSYVHYDKDAPGGKESALHALRHLKPRFGERIHVTTHPEHTLGHEHTFDSPGKAAHHIRNDGENEMKESSIQEVSNPHETIRSLLRLADRPGTSAEGENARRRANALAKKHGISLNAPSHQHHSASSEPAPKRPQHPWHDVAVGHGWKHKHTFGNAGMYRHIYEHPSEDRELNLHTEPVKGHHSWIHGRYGQVFVGGSVKHGDDKKSLHNYLKSRTSQKMNAESKQQLLLKRVLLEAVSFSKEIGKQWDEHNPGDVQAQLPITHCAICGETGHPASKHVGSEAGKEAIAKFEKKEVKEAEVKPKEKEHKHDASTFHRWGGRGSRWKQFMKKLHTEDEIEGNDHSEKCPDCGKEHAPSVPCPKKKLLFGDEMQEGFSLSKPGTNHPKDSFEYLHKPSNTRFTMNHAGVRDGRSYWNGVKKTGRQSDRDDVRRLNVREDEVAEGTKFSRSHGNDEGQAKAHLDRLQKQGVKAWMKKAQDGVHHVFWMGEGEMAEGQKKYDRGADVRAIARERVGHVPGRRVIVSKKDKKLKHKADYFNEDEGE